MTYFIYGASPWAIPLLMLAVLGLSIELPYRFARKIFRAKGSDVDAFNVIQAGLLTLASFVLGLSFAQASGRFDDRRALVVKEANAIGTTWLRADQLAPAHAARFRQILTAYTDARLTAYETPHDPQLYERTLRQSDADQSRLWEIASSELRERPANLGLSLLMQTLNDTIDVSAEQLQALTTHVPTVGVVLTLGLVTLGALSLGLRFALTASRPPVLCAIYVLASVVVISMMIDYDRPQDGFVRVNLNPLQTQLAAMQAPPP